LFVYIDLSEISGINCHLGVYEIWNSKQTGEPPWRFRPFLRGNAGLIVQGLRRATIGNGAFRAGRLSDVLSINGAIIGRRQLAPLLGAMVAA
jgi:hypothetical protein